MSAPMTPVLSSLSAEQRTSVEALPSIVSFPRARDTRDLMYYVDYRRDAKPLMRAWLVPALATFEDLFVLDGESHGDAVTVCGILAQREIGRAANPHERKLIAECVRDLVVIRTAERKRARELARAIL